MKATTMKLKNTAAIALSIAGLGLLTSTGKAQAATVGTQGFADIGAPTTNTGDVNTATVFNIGNLVTTGSQSGIFAGFPNTSFGPVSFNTTNPASLSFGNQSFGNFLSSSITTTSNVIGAVSFYVLGNEIGGLVGPTPTPASFTISFTQTGPSVSDSGTLAIPPSRGATVPEPSEVLGTLAFGAIVAGGLLQRKISKLA